MTRIPAKHAAARALEDSLRTLGEQRASATRPRRRLTVHGPRVVVIALTVLLLVAVAATGTKVFLGDGAVLDPDSAGLGGRLAPAPAYRQLAQASARDPTDHRPWGLRTFKSANGETCLALCGSWATASASWPSASSKSCRRARAASAGRWHASIW